jgi:lactoylglutathione lyase
MNSWVGQFCITVTDLEKAEQLYAGIFGLQVEQRIEIPDAKELVLGNGEQGGKIQLAQRHDVAGPIDHGNALWKLYIYCDDCDAMYHAALGFGCESVSPPQRLEKWPVSMAFITDPDGYTIEILQRHTQS